MKFSAPSWPVVQPRGWQARAMPVIADHYAKADPEPGIVSAVMRSGKSILIDELCGTAILEPNQIIVISTSSQRLTEDLYKSVFRRCVPAKTVGIWYGKQKRLGQVIVCCNDSLEQLANAIRQRGLTVCFWIADEVHRTESSTLLKACEILSPLESIGFTATAFRSNQKQTISLFKKILVKYEAKDAVADGVVVPWKIINWSGEDKELDESCLDMIREHGNGPGLVNAATIKDAIDYASYLTANGIPAEPLHSKQNRFQQDAILERVRKGQLRCAVHINTLVEGVTLPWLYWLCMRRQVGARVRFIQEIGRVLGSCPGKTIATFLDPHDLFGSFNLSYEEALGEPAEEEEKKDPLEDLKESAERIVLLDPALSLALVESIIRALVVACDTSGILHARKPIKKTDRLRPSNEVQHAAIRLAIKKVRGIAGDGWNACLDSIAKHPGRIRFGFCAELYLALNSIYKAGKWPKIQSGDCVIQGLPEVKQIEKEVPLVLDKQGQFNVDWSGM